VRRRSFKRTAIHNLRVTGAVAEGEGLALSEPLLAAADIEAFEQLVVTNMRGGNWDNRVPTFVQPAAAGVVEARGSLSRFLRPGDLICLITRGALDDDGLALFVDGELPLVDLGFDPAADHGNDVARATLALEREGTKEVVADLSDELRQLRERHLVRTRLANLITGLRVTHTHPDCLQGSAELPLGVMQAAHLTRYQSVYVYNADRGGVAETYVVPTRDQVMTTGAMAGFAPQGTTTSIAAFETARSGRKPTIHRA